ncbi:MAG: hypothetical protein ABI193_00370 [Minicystis sp.]
MTARVAPSSLLASALLVSACSATPPPPPVVLTAPPAAAALPADELRVVSDTRFWVVADGRAWETRDGGAVFVARPLFGRPVGDDASLSIDLSPRPDAPALRA